MERLYTFDAMRGVAAIAVAIFHLSYFRVYVPAGYLAVDFFFALSGFVIGSKYDSKLLMGLSPWIFIRSRIIRLYPMFAVGLGIAFIVEMLAIAVGSGAALTLYEIMLSFPVSLLMLPNFIGKENLFPSNIPAWSLMKEMIINFIYCFMLVRMNLRQIAILVAISALSLILVSVYHNDLSLGDSWPDIYGGLIRVTFGFSVGLLISRTLSNVVSRISIAFILPVFVLVLMLVSGCVHKYRLYLDLMLVIAGVPLLVIAGASLQPPKIFQKFSSFLGDISYPIYIIHFPLVYLGAVAGRRFHLPPAVWATITLVCLISLAYILGRFVDPVLRNLLAKLMDRLQVKLEPRQQRSRAS